ncbi:deoxynucleoside kinase [Candidatus Woesearchaeota archaeon]|nr:deoxynucleoside kinase [Candidatus Woesearchaeota archaeon]
MTFVSIAGNIGSGKTTLAKKIAERFGYRLFVESTESPLWSKFYKDVENGVKPSEYAFLLQEHYLFSRAATHLDMQYFDGSSVQDRTIYEDRGIFARHLHDLGFISDEKYGDYLNDFDVCTKSLRQPDLLVILHASVGTLRKRIKQRLEMDKGRETERQLINPKSTYLEELGFLYMNFMNDYDGKNIIIPTTDLNFVDNPGHLEIVLDMIKRKI